MKLNIIILAIIAGAVTCPVYAQLSNGEQQLVNNYINTYSSILGDKVTNIRNRGSLQSIKDYLQGNSYWDGHSTVHYPALEDAAKPSITPLSTNISNVDTQKNQQVIEEASRIKQQQIEDAANQQRQRDLEQQQQQAIEKANLLKQQQIEDAANQQRQRDLEQQQQAIEKANLLKQQQIEDAANQQRQRDLEQQQQQAIEKANLLKQQQIEDAANQQRQRDLQQQQQQAIEKANLLKQQQIEDAARQQRQHDLDQQQQQAIEKANLLKQQQIEEAARHQYENEITDAITRNTSRIDDARANTEANRQALQATNQRVAGNSAAIASHEQRIEKLEASNSANFGKLKNELDENRQRASAAISGVAAMANIPQVIQGQTFSVGAGVGTTDSESALAVGFSARAAEHVVVKASVSDDTQQNFVVGGGVSYGW